jgi:integrase
MTPSCNSLASRRYRALVLLGTFGGLRWGELAALRRGDIDLKACTVSVDRQHMLADTVGKWPGHRCARSGNRPTTATHLARKWHGSRRVPRKRPHHTDQYGL